MDWWRDQWKRARNPRTYVLAALLVATLVAIRSLDERADAMRAKARAAGAVAPAAAPTPAIPATGKVGPSTPTPDGWGRDPFDQRFGRGTAPVPTAPRAPRAPETTGLRLQGVMNGPGGRSALINGEIVREGERVGSREVLQIGVRSVLLMDHGTVTTLTLKGDGS